MTRFLILLSYLLIPINSSYADNSATEQSCRDHQCAAVVDAGSTGSRLHIYSFDLDENNNPVKINEVWFKKITPGISTIDGNSETIQSYLTILFANAPNQNIPVYFYATAGMRLLSQPKQARYFKNIQQWFAQQSQWPLRSAKTITGNEEGLYGWLSINYQLGSFSSPENSLVSVMDMGGASVQVAFPVENTSNIDVNDLMVVNIYGRQIKLFVHSFLGLGQTLVSNQFLDSVNCFTNEYQLPSGFPAQGDATICQRDVSRLINAVHGASRIVKPVLAKNPVGTWYAMGGLVNMITDKPFHFVNQQFTNQTLLQQADNELCQKQWMDLDLQYPENEYLYGYCLLSSYYYALMVNGYGLQPQLPIHHLANPQNSDWTLGVVLHQS